MCSCHAILECCVTFSGVKLSIRSFVLFISAFHMNWNLGLGEEFAFLWERLGPSVFYRKQQY